MVRVEPVQLALPQRRPHRQHLHFHGRGIQHHQQALRQARGGGCQRRAIVLRQRLPDDLDERLQRIGTGQDDRDDLVAAPIGGLVARGKAFVVGERHRAGVRRV
jgi:hypothetical protein